MSRFGFGFGFGTVFGSGGGGFPLTTARNFTTLDPAFGMRWSIPTHTSSGDFTHTMEFLFNDLTSAMVLLSGGVDSVNESFLRLDPTDGSVDLDVDGSFLGGSAGAFTADNKLHVISLSRVGSDYSIKIDGIEVQTFNQSPADFIVENIAVRTGLGFQFFEGILANLDLDGDRFYPIDETWIGPSTVLVDHSGNGQNGTAVNIDEDDSENFTFDGSVSPNTWTNDDELRVLEVAGT